MMTESLTSAPFMNLRIRRSQERGRSEFGWLDSRHTFSFGEYNDPSHMGWRSLRVINEDRVEPDAGFPNHPHFNMEIFSYVVSGELEHKDSMGNLSRIKAGELQLLSAGRGVLHSEYNPSSDESVHFLQVWIRPERPGTDPFYAEWKPQKSQHDEPAVLLLSPDGRNGSLPIRQDAYVWRIRLVEGDEEPLEVEEGRGIWIQVIRGEIFVGEVRLAAGDALACDEPGQLELRVGQDAECLVFDLG